MGMAIETPARVNDEPRAETAFRLDPWGGCQRIAYRRPGGAMAEFTLDAGGAVLRQKLTCGVPLSMAIPNRAFQGVAAKAVEQADGSMVVTLELLHADADLCAPLGRYESVEDAAADWHSWARRCALPMLMLSADGAVETVKDAGGVSSRAAKPRRARLTQLARRPRFLRRRRTGMVGPVVRITAEEIIARN